MKNKLMKYVYKLLNNKINKNIKNYLLQIQKQILILTIGKITTISIIMFFRKKKIKTKMIILKFPSFNLKFKI